MDRRGFLATTAAAAASLVTGDVGAAERLRRIPVNLSVVEGVEGLDWENMDNVQLYRLPSGPWRMAGVACDDEYKADVPMNASDVDLAKVEQQLPWVCQH